MRAASITIALAACSLLGGCTLLVDDRLEEQSADSDASAGNDAASGEDDSASGEHDAGAPGRDASQGPERDASAPGEHDAGDAAVADDAVVADGAAGDAVSPDASVSSAEVQLCAGQDHACAVTKAGKILCWGANGDDQTMFPPDRSYRRVACGDYHSCALDSAGALLCVGRNRNGQRVTQPGPYAELTAGDAHTCVLDAAGNARCFGDDAGGQSTPPNVALRSLSAGTGFSCAIRRADSKVQCWGFAASELTNAVADTAFASIDAARNYVCGVTDGGAVRCWSINPPPGADHALKVSAGVFGACALLADRSVRCWNGTNVETPFADKGPFQDVIVGGTGRCLLPVQGSLVCEPGAPLSALATGPARFD
jgi:hypothetical protein